MPSQAQAINKYSPDQLETINNVKFTRREIDILACLLSGKSSKKIGDLLSIAPKTVAAHVHNIMEKLGCHSRERVTELLECSSQLPAFRKHYFFLLMQSDFMKKLQQVYRQIYKTAPTCLIDDQENSEGISLLKIEQDLKLAGLNIVKGDFEDHLKVASIFCITTFNKIQEAKNDAIIQYLEKAKSNLATVVFLIQGAIPNDLPHLQNVHFLSWENSYPLLTLEILKCLVPSVSVESMIADFKQQWGRLLDLKDSDFDLNNFHRSEEKGEYDNSALMKYFTQYKRVLWSVIALSVITVCCLLIIGTKILHFSSHAPTPPVRSDLPLPTCSHLLARPHLLTKIAEKFKGPEDIQTVILVSMGGTGKTTLARQYMKTQECPVVWEINAENQKALIASFEHLAYALSPNPEDRKELDTIKKIDNVSEYIKKLLHVVKQKLKTRKQWVLLFDNVENFSDIQPFFPTDPKTWGTGRVLITTRNRHLKDNHQINAKNVISITPLDAQEELILFSKIMQQKDEDKSQSMTEEQKKKLKEFLKKLPPYPLDVTIAARHLSSTGMSQEEYLKNLHAPGEGFDQVQSLLMQEMINYAKTRYGIITSSVKRLIGINPEFTELLLFISTIGSQDIPKDVLVRYKNAAIVDQFIQQMCKLSLLNYQPGLNQKESTLSIHRSIQQMIFVYLTHMLTAEKKEKYFGEIIETVENYCLPAIDQIDIPKMRSFLYHLHTLEAHKDIYSAVHKGTLELLLGCIYCHFGDPVKAKEFLDPSLKRLSEHYGNTPHPRLLRSLTYLGIVEKDAGNYAIAQPLLERSVLLHDSTPNSDQLSLALALRHLFYVYRSIADFDKAKAVIERSIDIYTKYDNNSVNLALAYADLASLYHDGPGDYEQAIYYRAKSLSMLQKLCGPDHIKTLLVRALLGMDYRRAGRYTEALHAFKDSYMVYKDQYPDSFYHVSLVAIHLGDSYRILGLYKTAEPFLLEGYKIAQDYFGLDHTHTDWRSIFVAKLYLETKNYVEAKRILEKSLRGHCKHFGTKHYKIGFISHLLAQVYEGLGDYQKAQELFEISLSLYADKYGQNHLDYAVILKDFGHLHILKGEYEKAEDMIKTALIILQQAKHPESYKCFEYLGELYQAKGLKDQAKTNFQQALNIAKAHFPKESAHIVRIETKLHAL